MPITFGIFWALRLFANPADVAAMKITDLPVAVLARQSPQSSTPIICEDTVPVTGSNTPIPARGFITCCDNATDEVIVKGLNNFVSQGGRFIDTAPDYGTGEALVGQLVKLSGVDRSEFWISSKVDTDGWATWCASTATPPASLSECTLQQVKKTLSIMGLNYVDVMTLHFGPAQAALQGAAFTPERHVSMWQGLIDAKDLGLVRNIGVCETSQSEIQNLFDKTEVMPAIVLTWLHPWMPAAQIDYVKWAQGEGIAVVIYGDFEFKSLSMAKESHAMVQAAVDAGKRHDKTWGQLILQWALDQGVSVVTPLYDPQYAAEDLPCLGFTLDAEDLELLASVESVPCSDGPSRSKQLFPGCLQDLKEPGAGGAEPRGVTHAWLSFLLRAFLG